jgi:hypothetical protein
MKRGMNCPDLGKGKKGEIEILVQSYRVQSEY